MSVELNGLVVVPLLFVLGAFVGLFFHTRRLEAWLRRATDREFELADEVHKYRRLWPDWRWPGIPEAPDPEGEQYQRELNRFWRSKREEVLG